MSARRALVVCIALATPSLAAADFKYPLDALPRDAPAHGGVACPRVALEQYDGAVVRYQKPVRIYIGFEEHLRRFEEIVRQTAVEVYGRAPLRIVHDGTYNCRRIRGIATLISEHALGNAIDVEAFDFGPAPPGTHEPAALRRAFEVSVGRYWNGHAGAAAVHARFLHLLAHRIIDAEIFRVVLGPSYPGHQSHLHLDLAPYRLVDVFGFDPRHSSPL